MNQSAEYKLLYAEGRLIEEQMNAFGREGWRVLAFNVATSGKEPKFCALLEKRAG